MPPKAEPITLPLPPEFVPPMVNSIELPPVKSVSEANIKIEPVGLAPEVTVKFRSNCGTAALPRSGLLCEVLSKNVYPLSVAAAIIAPVMGLPSCPAALS